MRTILSLCLLVSFVGCAPGLFPVVQPPAPSPAAGQTITVKLEVVDGKLTVTDGTLNVGNGKLAVSSSSEADCPCCGVTGVCRGLCDKSGCVCRREAASPVGASPRFVATPLKIERRKLTMLMMEGGRGVCPGCDAAKDAIKAAKDLPFDVDFETSRSPPGGWLPCAVWVDRSGKQRYWSPPGQQWTDSSLSELVAAVRATL